MRYPPDVQAAYEAFGANCGPCSLAAILMQPVNAVRPLLDGFDQRKYVNPTHMQAALRKAGLRFQTIGRHLPQYGLVFIQWGGYANKSIRVQYTHTHWIAVAGQAVFDVNMASLTTWKNWQEVLPRLMRQHGKGDGTFFVRSGIEITPHITPKERQ